MQKDVKTNVTINSVLATKIEEKYQTNLSHAVLCVVLNVIREENYILPIKTSLYDYLKSFGLESINANREYETIRTNEWCLNVLKRKISFKGSPIKRRKSKNDNDSAIVEQAMLNDLFQQERIYNNNPKPIIYLLGNKCENSKEKKNLLNNYDSVVRKAVNDITGSSLCNSINFVDCFAGTGALSLHTIIDYPNINYILNEYDKNRYNLLKVIKEDPVAFMKTASKFQKGKKEFNSLRENKSGKSIRKAARYYYLNHYSIRNNEISYDAKASKDTYLKKLITVPDIAYKLRNFTMYNEDALALIQKPEINSKNTILVLDPPYPKTEYVYDKKNAPLDFSKKHTILADYLAKDFNGKFIFFCRITGPKGEKDREKSDIEMEYTIDCLYRGKGFYCIDTVTEYDENGRSSVIERIITNFSISDLEGARAYE